MPPRKHVLAALLAAPLSLGPVHDAEAELDVPAIGSAGPLGAHAAALAALSAACPVPSFDGAQVRGRFLSSSYDVRWADGSPMGVIEEEGGVHHFRGTGGETIAKGTLQRSGDDAAMTVTGCQGELVAVISEREGPDGERDYSVTGAAAGATGTIGYLQSRWSLTTAAGAVSFEDDHWFLDSWRVRGPGDARVSAMLVVMNSAANRRESQRRGHERRGDRPGRD